VSARLRTRRLLKRGYEIGTSVPAAAIDTVLDPLRTWRGPMNGQTGRQDLTRAIFRAYAPEQVVESGTFRGGTTEFLADLSRVPTFSVDCRSRYSGYARRRLADRPWVTIELADSRAFLRQLALDPVVRRRRTFFYLDAHCEGDLRLREELRIVSAHWADAVIMIDDFEVDGDPGYEFDDYGPGKRLDASYLPPLPGWERFCPSLASSDECGARRGCAVLASPASVPVLRGLGSLRRP
jgi:hypothetical protein